MMMDGEEKIEKMDGWRRRVVRALTEALPKSNHKGIFIYSRLERNDTTKDQAENTDGGGARDVEVSGERTGRTRRAARRRSGRAGRGVRAGRGAAGGGGGARATGRRTGALGRLELSGSAELVGAGGRDAGRDGGLVRSVRARAGEVRVIRAGARAL